MAAPWEKYQAQTKATAKEGPWTKFENETGLPKSREEKIALIQQKSKESGDGAGFLDSLLSGAVSVGNTIDSYTGAPMRAAISSAQRIQEPGSQNPIMAAVRQFGENPLLAPTGRDIVRKAGVPDTALSEVAPSVFTTDPEKAKDWFKFEKGGAADITASGAAGLGMDLAADPLNFVPVTRVAKLVSDGVGAGARGITKAASKVGSVAARGGEAALQTAAKIPGARPVGVVANVIGETATETASAIKNMFTPRQAGDYVKLTQIAKTHGINPADLPDAIEFGTHSVISRAARHKAEGPLGEKSLTKFHSALESVRDATENSIMKISGGAVPSQIEAGDMIRKGFDQGVSNFFQNVGMTHNKVMDAMPGLQVAPDSLAKIDSKLNGIEKWAKGQSIRGITQTKRTQSDQLLAAVNAARAGNGSYKQTVEALRDIGEIAFMSENSLADIPADIAKFRDLYFTIDDALIDTVEKSAGGPVAAELRESNKAISEFLGEKSVISSIVGNKRLAPEKVFKALVEHGDTKKIAALKKILPPETFNQLKGSFLQSQLRKNATDVFTFNGFHNNLRNKKNVLGSLLDAREVQELDDLIHLGTRFGDPVLSYSGTGASNVFSNMATGVRNAVANESVVGLLKDSARNRSAKEAAQIVAKEAAQIVAKEAPMLGVGKAVSANAPKTPPAVLLNDNYKKLANLSPFAARVLSKGSDKDEKSDGKPTGPKLWALNGFGKMLEHDKTKMNAALAEKLVTSQKGRDMLVQASDLKPGSKAMNNLFDQIKARPEFNVAKFLGPK